MTTLHRALVRSRLGMASAIRRAARAAHAARGATTRSERGDVPGWVLITLMTAGLVAALWAVAEDQLKALFTEALDSARR